MSLVAIDWNPNPRSLRTFGIILLAGFGAVGAGFWFGWPYPASQTAAAVLWIAGGAVGLLGLTGTRAALPFYLAWMSLAWIMGNIVSRVVLTLFYFLLITPMGLCRRFLGRDPLKLKKPDQDSFWMATEYDTDPKGYERQF